MNTNDDVMATHDLIKSSLYQEDELAAMAAEGKQVPEDQAIDMHFLRVLYSPNADKEKFLAWLRHMVKPGSGVHVDLDIDRLKNGPSYIEVGGWVGDQTDALMIMALGKHHRLWSIITPETIGVTGEEANKMAGLGFVFLHPVPDFESLVAA